MKLVRVERTSTGFLLDPSPYLDKLSEIRGDLPAGALSFAENVEHYDFWSERCVKDLKIVSIVVSKTQDVSGLVISLAFNDYAPEGLVLRYRDASSVSISTVGTNVGIDDDLISRLGPLQLDEIMPHKFGCDHELKFIGGVIQVICADLEATWVRRKDHSR